MSNRAKKLLVFLLLFCYSLFVLVILVIFYLSTSRLNKMFSRKCSVIFNSNSYPSRSLLLAHELLGTAKSLHVKQILSSLLHFKSQNRLLVNRDSSLPFDRRENIIKNITYFHKFINVFFFFTHMNIFA